MTELAVDVHAHYLSPHCVDLSMSDPDVVGAPRFRDLEDRADWMEQTGIGLQILAPELRYVMPIRGTRDEVAWAERVNAAVAEDITNRSDFAALALVPLVDGEAAARVLTHATQELGLCGGLIHTTPVGGLSAPYLESLWSTAAALDVPLVVHSSASDDDRLRRFDLDVRMGRSHDVGLAAAELIFGGVMERYENLKILLVTAGGSLPYLIGRLDQDYRLKDGRALQRAPSEYAARFYYDTLCFGREQFALLYEIAGPDRIMLGTDWPLPLFEDDPRRFLLDAGKDLLSEEHTTRILAGTARTLFSL